MTDKINQSMERVLAHAENSVKLPQSAMQVLELTRHSDTPVHKLVATIEVDPALAARVLRVANSSAYAKSGGVTDIGNAVNWMGFREVSRIAIAMSALAEMSKLESELMAMTDFQHHSLFTAALSDEIARSTGVGLDSAFTAGLLHDIGLLILFHTSAEQMMEVMDKAMLDDDVSLVRAEKEVFGFDHTKVGAALAERWELPPTIVAAIRHHHDAQWPRAFAQDIAIVAYANLLTTRASDPSDDPPLQSSEILESVARTINIERLDIEACMNSATAVAEKMRPSAATSGDATDA